VYAGGITWKIKDFAKKLYDKGNMNIKMQTQSELISSSVLFLLNSFILDNFFRNGFLKHNANTDLYEVTSIIYKKKKEILMNSAIRSFKSVFDKKKHHFLEQSTNKNDLKTNLILIVAQIFELIGLATYKIKSGDRPEFFIRINNESELVKMTNLFMIRVRWPRLEIDMKMLRILWPISS